MAARQFDIRPVAFLAWFDQWIRHDYSERMTKGSLMIPAYFFGDHKFFLDISRTIVYETVGEITEEKLNNEDGIHSHGRLELPPSFIGTYHEQNPVSSPHADDRQPNSMPQKIVSRPCCRPASMLLSRRSFEDPNVTVSRQHSSHT